jgi:hypothetical protein
LTITNVFENGIRMFLIFSLIFGKKMSSISYNIYQSDLAGHDSFRGVVDDKQRLVMWHA